MHAESITVIEARSAAELAVWQETAARGWEHLDADARRASDAFAAAVAASDRDTLLLAYLDDEDVPAGCATLTHNGKVATLGGMSTLPARRGRGIQSQLIRHRLDLADTRGCTLVTTLAAPGSTSARNVQRMGFEPAFTVETWTREATMHS